MRVAEIGTVRCDPEQAGAVRSISISNDRTWGFTMTFKKIRNSKKVKTAVGAAVATAIGTTPFVALASGSNMG